jgi:hypothetical protein
VALAFALSEAPLMKATRCGAFVARIVDDVISQIQASLELWPTIVEISYYQKDKQLLPQTRIKNKRITNS